MFIFTIEARASQFRNTGFTWEPKAFANFLMLGILFNLLRYRLRFFNKRMIIMLITLITTFSTTGYIMIFGCISMFILVNIKISTRVFFFPFILIALLLQY